MAEKRENNIGDNGAEKKREKATDMELADFLIEHIDNPCEVEVAPGQVENIRGFYIREAENALPIFIDDEARKKLEDKISEYKS